MDWSQVKERDSIYLNLGGAEYCHPMTGYEEYVSVDACEPQAEHAIQHDLTTPMPLPDESVARIHTEDCLEHLELKDIHGVLAECYRVLQTGGRMRIGVPDYNNPKDRHCLVAGHDSRFPGHLTLTTYPLMRQIVAESPFEKAHFYHYWDGDRFVHEEMDFSLGLIRRSPDLHPNCRRTNLRSHVKALVRDSAFLLSKGFRVTDLEMSTRKGHPLHVTSLTVDLFKNPS